MGFKNMKRDDHGHVISNDETDGQKCQHQSGGISKEKYNELKSKNDAKMQQMNDDAKKAADNYNESMANYRANTEKEQKEILQKLKYSEAFDDDYEEEFKEPSPEDEKQYVDKVMADIADASDKNTFEYVSDNIDELTEAGLISDETSDRLMDALNRKIDEVNNDDEDLIKAINAADDEVLDDQFGKDTSERKLVGAMKSPAKEDNLGKIQSKNNPQLTGEKILHEGWKRNIPQDKIAAAIARELGVSLEDAKEYVEKESKLPEAIDFDEWIENSKKPQKKPVEEVLKNARMQSNWDALRSSGYINSDGQLIAEDDDASHDDINKLLGADLYNDYDMVALNPGVYGSRAAKIDVPKNRQLTRNEEQAIERFVNNLGRKTVDFGAGPIDTLENDGAAIVKKLRRYLLNKGN